MAQLTQAQAITAAEVAIGNELQAANIYANNPSQRNALAVAIIAAMKTAEIGVAHVADIAKIK